MSPMLQTKVPGMGSALIHCPCWFFTCKYQGLAADSSIMYDIALLCVVKHITVSQHIALDVSCVQHVSKPTRPVLYLPIPQADTPLFLLLSMVVSVWVTDRDNTRLHCT